MKKKLVYIAGKLNDDAVKYLFNVNLMLTIGSYVRKRGFLAFTPCNDLLNGIHGGDMFYSDYAETNMAILERSDAVFLVPNWETSNGTKAEIKRAKELNIPIFENLDKLAEWGSDETNQ